MLTFQEVLQKATKNDPKLDQKRVARAFDYAEKVHENQYRTSGDPYVSHLLAVTNILIDFKPDEDTIIACLLHGIPNIESYDREALKDIFGNKVYFLVNALEGLQKVKSRDENAESENIRKLFVTMAQDVRVILIKMADRLHNMETLSFRSVQKQKQVAKETLDVYVPIAARMSIYSLKGRLEDFAFQYLYPRQHAQLKIDLDEYLSERERTIEDSIKELKQLLSEHNVQATVDGRMKNLYSIYRKLKVKSRSSLQDLYDVYAIRIVVPDKFDDGQNIVTEHLYGLLGLVHARWKPLPHRFKDYVAVPKLNGYQSLHTALMGLSMNSTHPTEVQIRTQRMHEEAEFGIASHWIYDSSKKKKKSSEVQKATFFDTDESWVDALSSDSKTGENDDILDRLKLDIFSDRIFVMTPTGEVKDLPKGSTPIDFAYAVHSDVGHRCRLAKVNGAVVPLDYHLKNGEVVEVMLGKKFDPKPVWLSFAKTASAKSKIRTYFRSLDKESTFRKGKDILNEELIKLGQSALNDNITLFREYNNRRLTLREREGLVEEVGNGSVDAKTLLKKAFGLRVVSNRKHSMVRARTRSIPKGKNVKSAEDQICIAGEMGLPYRLGNCCKPREGLLIVAYVTRSHTMTIHLQRCKLLRDASEERILKATWGEQKSDQIYSVKIRLRAKDRVGLIRDISDVITSMNVNIRTFSDLQQVDKEVVFREVVVDVAGDDQLEKMMDRLERIRNVLEVKRAGDR